MPSGRPRRSPNAQVMRAASILLAAFATFATIALLVDGQYFVAVVYATLAVAFAVRWWWQGRHS